MTRLSDAAADLPPDGRCECGCRNVCARNSWTIRVQCDTGCACWPCPVCHPENFEDDDE